jgi:hypothetical protein
MPKKIDRTGPNQVRYFPLKEKTRQKRVCHFYGSDGA